jgi:hypothetical protein
MKKLFKSRMLLAALGTCWTFSAGASPYVITDMEALGMGGAGVSSANQYLSLTNPALVASNLRTTNDFMMTPSMHWFVYDNEELQDGLDQFQASKSAANLQALSGKSMINHWGANFGIVLHNPKGSTKLYVTSYSYTRAKVTVDPSDLSGTPASYASTIDVSGLTMVETGLSFAKSRRIPGFNIGEAKLAVTGKVMNGKVHNFSSSVESVDVVDGLYATGKTTQRLNIDLSASKELGRVWSFGLVARNIFPHKFKNESGPDVQIGPQLRAGTAFHGHHNFWALDMDLTQNRPVVDFGRTQMISGGFGYELGKNFTVRAGVGHDLMGTFPTTYTVGAGVSSNVLHAMTALMFTDAGFSGFGLQGALGF